MDSFNNNDPFKELVKSKLANYKHETPPTGWDELERSLIAAKKTKVVHTKWIASSVAAIAAAFIGVFFLFLNTNKELPIQTGKKETEQQTRPIYKEVKPLITKQSSIEVDESSTQLFTDNISSLQEETSIIRISKEEEGANLNNIGDNVLPQTSNNITPSEDEPSEKKSKLLDEIDEETKQQMTRK